MRSYAYPLPKAPSNSNTHTTQHYGNLHLRDTLVEYRTTTGAYYILLETGRTVRSVSYRHLLSHPVLAIIIGVPKCEQAFSDNMRHVLSHNKSYFYNNDLNCVEGIHPIGRLYCNRRKFLWHITRMSLNN